MAVRVRDARPDDEAAWRALWGGYLRFYEATVPEETTAATWARILEPSSAVFCRIAEAGGAPTGFAVAVVHPGTWRRAPLVYLEDLYVDPAARGHGLGRALIEDLVALGRSRGWSKLYWHTRSGNAAARRLYDAFASADDFVRYTVDLGGA